MSRNIYVASGRDRPCPTLASAVSTRRIRDGEIAQHIDSIIVTIMVCFVSK